MNKIVRDHKERLYNLKIPKILSLLENFISVRRGNYILIFTNAKKPLDITFRILHKHMYAMEGKNNVFLNSEKISWQLTIL